VDSTPDPSSPSRLKLTRETGMTNVPGWKQMILSSARPDEPPSGLGDCPILPVPPLGEDRSGIAELSGGADRHASCCGGA
jgi:hypothetical protein